MYSWRAEFSLAAAGVSQLWDCRFKWCDSTYYEGSWVYGREEGLGTKVWPDSESYKGHWKEGLRNGQGKAVFANQDCYQGDFLDGQVIDSGHSKPQGWTHEKNRRKTGWKVASLCVLLPCDLISAFLITHFRSRVSPSFSQED